MPETLAWSNAYSVRIEELDSQHLRLLGMLSALNDATEHGAAQAVLAPLLQALVQYAKAHFSTEEELLQRHNYPLLAEHKAEHDSFTARVLEFQGMLEAGTGDVVKPLLQFLHQWFDQHILEADQAYTSFLHARRAP